MKNTTSEKNEDLFLGYKTFDLSLNSCPNSYKEEYSDSSSTISRNGFFDLIKWVMQSSKFSVDGKKLLSDSSVVLPINEINYSVEVAASNIFFSVAKNYFFSSEVRGDVYGSCIDVVKADDHVLYRASLPCYDSSLGSLDFGSVGSFGCNSIDNKVASNSCLLAEDSSRAGYESGSAGSNDVGFGYGPDLGYDGRKVAHGCSSGVGSMGNGSDSGSVGSFGCNSIDNEWSCGSVLEIESTCIEGGFSVLMSSGVGSSGSSGVGSMGNGSGSGSSGDGSDSDDPNKRDFLAFAASGLVGVGASCAVWPLIDSMNPAEDVLANSSIEVDLENIKTGQSVTIKWRGKPIFIKNRTPEEIMESRNADIEKLRDSEPDEKRVKPSYDKWLVVVGVCTHLGCVPISEQTGWFCPCHGSYYDNSGRVVAGPAPKNLEVPPYEFITDTKIKIG